MTPPGSSGGPLRGLALAVSISESEGTPGHGFTTREVNRSVRVISRAVLAQGGRVAFGHGWRDDGVMSEVLEMAIEHQASGSQGATDEPLMINLVPWPHRSIASEADRKRYRDVLSIQDMPEPNEPAGTSDESKLVRSAVSLTKMRQSLTLMTNARLCIGGRTKGFSGFCSGIVEEAALSIKHQQPLYLTRLFGGAASQMIDVL